MNKDNSRIEKLGKDAFVRLRLDVEHGLNNKITRAIICNVEKEETDVTHYYAEDLNSLIVGLEKSNYKQKGDVYSLSIYVRKKLLDHMDA